MDETRSAFLAIVLLLLGVVDWCPRSTFNDTFLFPAVRTRSYILVLGDTSLKPLHHSHHHHLLSPPTTKAPKKDLSDFDEEDYDLDELEDEDEDDPNDTDDLFSNLHKLSASTSTPRPSSATSPSSTQKNLIKAKCPPELHGRCTCNHTYKQRYRFVVNCTRAGFTNADFMKYIPEETEAFFARGNNIKILPQNVFGVGRTFSALKEVDLSLNNIQEIHGKTFHGVSSVEVLILSQNQISVESLAAHPRLLSSFTSLTSLHLSNTFPPDPNLLPALSELFIASNLTHLYKLHLEGNSIERIPDPTTLCPLPALEQLYLANNQLSDLVLDRNCLSPALSYIDLSSNRIKTVRSPSFLLSTLQESTAEPQGLPPLRIDLHDNPFSCDCHLDPFLQWLKEIELKDHDRVRFPGGMRCASGLPSNNTHRILTEVTYTECPVPLAAEANDVMNAVSKGLLSVIALGVLGTCIAVGVWKGKGLRYLLCPAQVGASHLLSGGSGVKYTTVQDEEAAAEVAHV